MNFSSQTRASRATVVVREDSLGDQCLVAWVEAQPGHLVPDDARNRLRHRILSHVVGLNRLPLTSSGKLDRQALPTSYPHGATKAFVAPRNAIGDLVADRRSEVLNSKGLGVRDDFFEEPTIQAIATEVEARILNEMGEAPAPAADGRYAPSTPDPSGAKRKGGNERSDPDRGSTRIPGTVDVRN